jgi:hypothetical protein
MALQGSAGCVARREGERQPSEGLIARAHQINQMNYNLSDRTFELLRALL